MATVSWKQSVTTPRTTETARNGATLRRSSRTTRPRFHHAYSSSTNGNITTELFESIDARKNMKAES
jgi:hypothetical protein